MKCFIIVAIYTVAASVVQGDEYFASTRSYQCVVMHAVLTSFLSSLCHPGFKSAVNIFLKLKSAIGSLNAIWHL